MCRVLIIPGIKKHRVKETMAFVKAMGVAMTKGNNDGLGYAAVNERGDLFGERWFINSEAFRSPVKSKDFTEQKPVAEKMVSQFGKALKYQKTGGWVKPSTIDKYNRFGNDVIENASAITLHTRMATCEKNLTNVHPFYDEAMDTSLIHNGVISNHKDFDLKLSTCDSESILISYLKNNVNTDINQVQKMVDQLSGYYACGVFSRDNEGNRILDVFKLNNNNLSISYIYELETYVLSTMDRDIKDVCESLGFSHDGTQDIDNDIITRINPFTGDIIEQVSYAKKYAVQTYNRGMYSAYDDYDEFSWKGDDFVKTTKHERNTNNEEIISESLATLWTLKPKILELGTREVEEKIVGML